jgi:hypothetical protein
VQIVHGSRRGSRDIGHLGSAHDAQAVEALKAVAQQRLGGGQVELDLGIDDGALTSSGPGPLHIPTNPAPSSHARPEPKPTPPAGAAPPAIAGLTTHPAMRLRLNDAVTPRPHQLRLSP